MPKTIEFTLNGKQVSAKDGEKRMTCGLFHRKN
jgi:hypothetical protein